MNKLAELVANGTITVEELAKAQDLIYRAKVVTQGLEACKKNIAFPFGVKEIQCYSYTDSCGEYESRGICTIDGIFTCYSNWGGNHIIGKCNLTNFSEVFTAFDNNEFAADLQRFLLQQIKKAS